MRAVVLLLLAVTLFVGAPRAQDAAAVPPDTRFGDFYVELPADMQELDSEQEGTRIFRNDSIDLVVERGAGASFEGRDYDSRPGLKKIPAVVGGMETEMILFEDSQDGETRHVMAMQLTAPEGADALTLVATCTGARARLAAGRIFYSVDYKP